MRYPPGQKEQTRQRLLDLASELSKRNGFAAMSVDDLMSAAGLTAGAFYVHFESKNALFAELMRRELARSSEMLAPTEDEPDGVWLVRMLDRYLTPAHVQHPASGCVIPALGAEIARADPGIKRAYESAMTDLKDRMAQQLGDSELAWTLICQLVGTVVVARAMATKTAADEVVHASRAQLGRPAGPAALNRNRSTVRKRASKR